MRHCVRNNKILILDVIDFMSSNVVDFISSNVIGFMSSNVMDFVSSNVIDFVSSNDTKVLFLPEVTSPVSADKVFNLVKSLHDRNVRVYTRIEFGRL